MKSIKREINQDILKYLGNDQILLLIGARQVGKTTILRQIKTHLEVQSLQTHFINLEDPEYLALINESPKNLFKILSINLESKSYIFIDEIQYLDNPSNFLKYFYDEYGEKMKLIVSGSSAFYIDSKFQDSLAGRKKIFYVRNLSFSEFLLFKDQEALSKKSYISLSLKEKDIVQRAFEEYLVYGGYPRVALSSDLEEKKEILRELAYSYIKKDIFESKIKDDKSFYALMRILADQVGSLVNSNELASTLAISKSSVDNYLNILQKSFHIFLVKPFSKNIRKELTKMPKVYFADMGLRNFLVRDFEPYALRSDKGELLENIVFRKLLDTNHHEDIMFWRTAEKQELDFVLQDKAAIEVKANPEKFNVKKYQKFIEVYPEKELSLVSYDYKGSADFPVKYKDVLEL